MTECGDQANTDKAILDADDNEISSCLFSSFDHNSTLQKQNYLSEGCHGENRCLTGQESIILIKGDNALPWDTDAAIEDKMKPTEKCKLSTKHKKERKQHLQTGKDINKIAIKTSKQPAEPEEVAPWLAIDQGDDSKKARRRKKCSGSSAGFDKTNKPRSLRTEKDENTQMEKKKEEQLTKKEENSKFTVKHKEIAGSDVGKSLSLLGTHQCNETVNRTDNILQQVVKSTKLFPNETQGHDSISCHPLPKLTQDSLEVTDVAGVLHLPLEPPLSSNQVTVDAEASKEEDGKDPITLMLQDPESAEEGSGIKRTDDLILGNPASECSYSNSYSSPTMLKVANISTSQVSLTVTGSENLEHGKASLVPLDAVESAATDDETTGDEETEEDDDSDMDIFIPKNFVDKVLDKEEQAEKENFEDFEPPDPDDAWFQAQLHSLPTLFRVPSIFDLSRSRAMSRFRMVKNSQLILKKLRMIQQQTPSGTSSIRIPIKDDDDHVFVLRILEEVKNPYSRDSPTKVSQKKDKSTNGLSNEDCSARYHQTQNSPTENLEVNCLNNARFDPVYQESTKDALNTSNKVKDNLTIVAKDRLENDGITEKSPLEYFAAAVKFPEILAASSPSKDGSSVDSLSGDSLIRVAPEKESSTEVRSIENSLTNDTEAKCSISKYGHSETRTTNDEVGNADASPTADCNSEDRPSRDYDNVESSLAKDSNIQVCNDAESGRVINSNTESSLNKDSIAEDSTFADSDIEGSLTKDSKTRDSSDKDAPEKRLMKATPIIRSSIFTNFIVVLEWLLGMKERAEDDARCLVHAYPYCFIARANLFYILWKTGDHQGALATLRPMWRMKRSSPKIFEAIMDEEAANLAHCFTELGPEFIPEAVSLFEKAISRHPNWHEHKWHLALNLRRAHCASKRQPIPAINPDAALTRAFQLQLELHKLNETCEGAASELGEILNSCELFAPSKGEEECLRMAREAGLTASKCFEIVMGAKDAGSCSLVRAGKYFRYRKDYQKSYEALKRAVVEQDSAKAHHQFALTLSKLVWQSAAAKREKEGNTAEREQRTGFKWQRGWDSLQTQTYRTGQHHYLRASLNRRARIPRPDPRMADMERILKLGSTGPSKLTRESEYVQEMMDHLHAALRLSEGENAVVSYDLGVAYKNLGEYHDAFEQFVIIIDQDLLAQDVCRSLEQCGMVFLEQIKNEDCEPRHVQKLLCKANEALTMAIIYQARIVIDQRNSLDLVMPSVWENLYSLIHYLRLPERPEGTYRSRDNVVSVDKHGNDQTELWLLRLMWLYADTLDILKSLQRFTFQEALNPVILKTELLKAIRYDRFQEAVLLTYIFRLLTGKDQTGKQALEEGQFSPPGEHGDQVAAKVIKAHILAARSMLLVDIREGHGVGSTTLNRSMAHRFFRWVFQDSFPDKCCRSPQENYFQSKASCDQKQFTLSSAFDENDDDDDHHDESGLVKNFTTYHVAVLHEQDDQRVARAARVLSNILQQVCGLKTRWAGGDKQSLQDIHQENLKAGDQARVVIFIISKSGMSPEFEECVKRALSRPTANTVALTMEPSLTLPEPLYQCRSFPWNPDLGVMPDGADESKKWLDVICGLFCSLVDVDLLF